MASLLCPAVYSSTLFHALEENPKWFEDFERYLFCLLTHKWHQILMAQGHVTVSKTCYLYIVSYSWPLCSAHILVDGVNPLESHFQKSTNISAGVQHMSVSFVSLQSSRVHLQNSTVILRNIVEDLCDVAYQKYCKIVISKEVCLHYVTLPL